MSYRLRFINKVVYIVIFVWSLIMFATAAFLIYQDYSHAVALAKHEAIVS